MYIMLIKKKQKKSRNNSKTHALTNMKRESTRQREH